MKNLIRKILKEEFDSENFDWVSLDIDPIREFLYQKFIECKLEPVGNKHWFNWTRYVDKTGKILFLDNIETDKKDTILYFDYDEIYQKLKKMGLNTNEIEVLVKDTLYDTHKRKVDIASYGSISGQKRLYETHKRKVNITTPTTIINGTIF